MFSNAFTGIIASSYPQNTCAYVNIEVCNWSTASGVTDGTFLTALDAMVSAGKTNGWWATKSAIYVLCAGSSSAATYNLKNTLTFHASTSGTLTFASTGVTGDGSTGFINTTFVPSTDGFTTTDGYMSLYVRSNVNDAAYDMGSANNLSDVGCAFLITRYSGTAYGQYCNASYANGIGSSNSIGYWALLRDGGTTYLYKNGSSIKSTTETAVTPTTSAIYICAYDIGGTAYYFSAKELGFATIGSKPTSTQASNESTDVTTFLTTVGAN